MNSIILNLLKKDWILIWLIISSCIFLFVTDITFHSTNESSLLFLQISLLIGAFSGLLSIIRFLTLNKINFITLGVGSYLFFGHGGFAYSTFKTDINSIIEYFNRVGYSFDLLDIIYACLYANLVAILYILLSNFNKFNKNEVKPVINLAKKIKEIKKNSKELLAYSLVILTLKAYLIISGGVSFSFFGDNNYYLVYGSRSSQIAYFVIAIAVSSFFISLVLLFSKLIPQWLAICLIIPDILFAAILGRRPLIYHGLVAIFVYYLCSYRGDQNDRLDVHEKPDLKIGGAYKKPISKIRKRAIKDFFLIISSLFLTWIFIKAVSYVRFASFGISTISNLDLIPDLFRSIFSGDDSLDEMLTKNISIRNAFIVAYCSHVMHGFLQYGEVAWGRILIGDILQAIPSGIGFLDKSLNMQGEAIISGLTNTSVPDGSNTVFSYSIIDFPFFIGVIVYYLFLSSINFFFLRLSRFGVHSILIEMIVLSAFVYYYISFSETSITDLLLSIRSILIIIVVYFVVSSVFVERKIINKKNDRLS